VLNVHGIRDVRQMDIYTAEPLILKPSFVEVGIAIRKLTSYKTPSTDQILAEFIRVGGKPSILRYTDLFILYGMRRNCPSSGRSLLLLKFIKRIGRLIVNIFMASPSYQRPLNFI
jgi:hypothetical protein